MNTFARQNPPGPTRSDASLMVSEGNTSATVSQEMCEFLCVTIHELRNPLSAISGFSRTLLDGVDADTNTKEEQREYLGIVVEECDRRQRLVNDLSFVFKLEAGRPPEPEVVEIDLAALIMRIAQVESQAHIGRDIELRLPPGLPPLVGDEDRLAESFANLVDNAIKYSPEGGSVRIVARFDADQIVVGIQDDGVGIPEDETKRIFEKFHRVKCGSTAHIGGTGLGLYIVRHVVEEMHGGRVWCESVLGKGTTFWVELPIRRDEA